MVFARQTADRTFPQVIRCRRQVERSLSEIPEVGTRFDEVHTGIAFRALRCAVPRVAIPLGRALANLSSARIIGRTEFAHVVYVVMTANEQIHTVLILGPALHGAELFRQLDVLP